MNKHDGIPAGKLGESIVLSGARCADGGSADHISVEISEGIVSRVFKGAQAARAPARRNSVVDLSGYWLMPGLINAHDHLEYALYPRLADSPYKNYIEWGEDIHRKFPGLIVTHRAVSKDVRLWWGGIRNLLSGVTTVAHHNPLWPALKQSDFPVRVVEEYGWAHSVALGGDLSLARANTPKACPFIVHACEGVDELARAELCELDRLGLLDAFTVLVHGLAIDSQGAALMNARGASLIVCPSSNYTLFNVLPDMALLRRIRCIALGSDSSLTAAGDLLDEIRFAIQRCAIAPETIYRMVTKAPARILRLTRGEGSIVVSGVGDVIAVRDGGASPIERLDSLSSSDVELVVIAGRVQLASDSMLRRLPCSAVEGLEPLFLGSETRWLRAPIGDLLLGAEDVLGEGQVRLNGRIARASAHVGVPHVG